MATIKKCDMCGCELERTQEAWFRMRRVDPFYIGTMMYMDENACDCDLCYACAQKLKKIISGEIKV